MENVNDIVSPIFLRTSLEDDSDDIKEPEVFSMQPIYPNPFNPSTTISYEVAKRGPVKVTIYNVKGEMVKVLLDRVQESGNHSIVWDGSGSNGFKVSSGIYFCSVRANGSVKTRKLVLLR